jgi:hypothetical protein
MDTAGSESRAQQNVATPNFFHKMLNIFAISRDFTDKYYRLVSPQLAAGSFNPGLNRRLACLWENVMKFGA